MALPIDRWFISLLNPTDVPLFSKAGWALFTQGVFLRNSERSLKNHSEKLGKLMERWENPLQWPYLLLDSINFLLFCLRQLLWRPFFWLNERANWESWTGLFCGVGAIVAGFFELLFTLLFFVPMELTLMLLALLCSPLDWVNRTLLMLGYTVTLVSIGVALMDIVSGTFAWWIAMVAPLMIVIEIGIMIHHVGILHDFSRILYGQNPSLEVSEIKNAIKALKIIGEKFPQTARDCRNYIVKLQGYVNRVEHLDAREFTKQQQQEITNILANIENRIVPQLEEQIEKSNSPIPYVSASLVILLGLGLLTLVIVSVFFPLSSPLTLPFLFLGVKAFSIPMLAFAASAFLVMGGATTIMDKIVSDKVVTIGRWQPSLTETSFSNAIGENGQIRGGKQSTVYPQGIRPKKNREAEKSVYSWVENQKKVAPTNLPGSQPLKRPRPVLPQAPAGSAPSTPKTVRQSQKILTSPLTGPGSPACFQSKLKPESKHEQIVAGKLLNEEPRTEIEPDNLGDSIPTSPLL